MDGALHDRLFREPDGRWPGLLYVGASGLMLALFGYYELFSDGGAEIALPFGIAWFVAGAAELLPADRRRLAGWLRVTSTVFLAVLVAVVLLEYVPV